MIDNKTILITGAAGSIGRALVEKFAKFTNLNLVLFDRNENDLFFLIEKNRWNGVGLKFVLGDILDPSKLTYVFENNKIDYVIHCAAYKQVPLMESNIYEIIKNNIEGLLNVIKVSKKYQIAKFLFISSDKAVYPSSLMGLSKRVGEIIINRVNNSSSEMQLLSLRFSNLLNSNGSVLPLFEEQFMAYGEIYLTSNKSRRYFITNNELSDFVINALRYKGNSSLLMGDYNCELSIKDLAVSFLEKKGCKNIDNHIKYIGLRKGEKICEDLNYKYEVKRKLKNNLLIEVDMNIATSDDYLNNISNLVFQNSPNLEEETERKLTLLMKKYIV